jgi:hypothetical protein
MCMSGWLKDNIRVDCAYKNQLLINTMDPVLAKILQQGGQEGAPSSAEACLTAVLVLDAAVAQVCV